MSTILATRPTESSTSNATDTRPRSHPASSPRRGLIRNFRDESPLRIRNVTTP